MLSRDRTVRVRRANIHVALIFPASRSHYGSDLVIPSLIGFTRFSVLSPARPASAAAVSSTCYGPTSAGTPSNTERGTPIWPPDWTGSRASGIQKQEKSHN
jgi:hypothetical protein